MSRTRNSLKNIKYAVIGQAVALFISFIARMVFVKTLGSEYLGINGLFTNILSILSFAELGVGAAIVYSLYKPLAEKNVPKVKALMKLYKWAYITIGSIIALIGMTITPFLSLIIKDMPDIPHIDLIYLMFVANSAISYFFIYKRSLIIADQKRYIATFYRYGFFVVLNIFQIIVLLVTKNYIIFLILQILFTIVENLAISRKADSIYPFIREKTTEPLDAETKHTIGKNIRAMMGHKFGGIVVNGTDSLLISKLFGVIAVGLYSNYLLILSALNTIIAMAFQAVTASIGNLGATETEEKSLNIFKCLDLIGFWIYGLVSICLLNLLNPFIEIWIGEQYLFPSYIVLIIIINFYLTGMRSVLTFRDALGLFWHDRYKPFFESVIKIIVSILLARELGIAGVFIGTIISTLTTCFWIEPYILFKYGLKSSIVPYLKRYFINSLILLLTGLVIWLLLSFINSDNILGFIYKTLVCLIVPNIIFLLFFWKTSELKYLLGVLKTNIRSDDVRL